MGELSFQNNMPDPLLAKKELPSFKFELEKPNGRMSGNSFGKEVSVEQLPISKGLAGVSMQLEPGVMRELHWHATAAECAFVISRPGLRAIRSTFWRPISINLQPCLRSSRAKMYSSLQTNNDLDRAIV